MDEQRISQQDLDALKKQIEQAERSFRAESHAIHEKLKQLQQRFNAQQLAFHNGQVVVEKPIFTQKEETKEEILDAFETNLKEKIETQKVIKIIDPLPEKEQSQQKEQHSKAQPKYQPKPTPKIPKEFKMPAFWAELFLPFTQFIALFQETYLHYKNQNRLPVFFMTIGGVAAILLGFGYLMQYVSASFFEAIKIGGSFLVSFGILSWGVRLISKNEKYREFGSALMGLSISLNYLILFNLSFSEAFFSVLSQPLVNFGLMTLNTFLALLLAFRYETRIVMVISLLGGAFTPLYVAQNTVPLMYFVYLWSLSVATLFVSVKIKWKTAELLTFFTASIALRMGIEIVEEPSLWAFTCIFMAFAYLFFYVCLFENKKIKQDLDRSAVIILAGTGSLLLYNLYEMYISRNGRFELGMLYAGNALVFLGSFFALRTIISKKIQVLFFILIGTFVGFSIFSFTERNIAGTLWAIEGLALVFCGFNFSLSGVRKEGYLVLAIGLLRISSSFIDIADNWTLILWTDGYFNLLSLGAILGILKLMCLRYTSELTDFEKTITYGVSEAIPIWLSFVLFTTSYFYFGIKTYNFAILGLYGLVWWGLRYKLILTELLGISCLVLTGFGLYESYLEVNSLVFAFQTTLGKIAGAEIYLSLWFLQFFYEKNNPKSTQLPVMKLFREVFYLAIPALHLSFVNRNYPEYMPVAFWGSYLSTFLVYEFTKKKAVLVELNLILMFATYLLYVSLNNQTIAYTSGLAGLGLLFLVFFVKKGYQHETFKNATLKFSFVYLWYFLGSCLFGFLEIYTRGDFVLAGFGTSLYFMVITYFYKNIAPLQNNYIFAYRLAFFGLAGSLATTLAGYYIGVNYATTAFNNLRFMLIGLNLAVLMAIIYNPNRYPVKEKGIWLFDMYVSHIFITLGYTSVIVSFTPNWIGVWLTIIVILHAIVMLFVSSKKEYSSLLRLSLVYFILAILKLFLNDMQGFETVQKVIVFMVIGVLMLLGSFLFMKYREKNT